MNRFGISDRTLVNLQDSVRLLSVDDLIVIAQAIKIEGVKAHVLPTLRILCSDSSWRVRYMVADKFIQVRISAAILTCGFRSQMSLDWI